jgi:hypothetical protein
MRHPLDWYRQGRNSALKMLEKRGLCPPAFAERQRQSWKEAPAEDAPDSEGAPDRQDDARSGH